MKSFLSIVVFFSGLAAAQAPSGIQDQRRYELVKCTSENVGTVWMSFGHLIRHGGESVETFVTEIVFFGKDGEVFRKVWMDYREALEEVDVRARERGIGVDFTTEAGAQHRLAILQYSDIETAFVGNWAVGGSKDLNGEAYCTVH